MKTKEELSALKEEVETMNAKLAELSDDELEQVSGGRAAAGIIPTIFVGAVQINTLGQAVNPTQAPDGDVNIRIRGIASVNGDTQPLYVVD